MKPWTLRLLLCGTKILISRREEMSTERLPFGADAIRRLYFPRYQPVIHATGEIPDTCASFCLSAKRISDAGVRRIQKVWTNSLDGKDATRVPKTSINGATRRKRIESEREIATVALLFRSQPET